MRAMNSAVRVIAMIVCASIVLVPACKKRDPNRYSNAEKGFSIRLPSSWEKQENVMGTDLIVVSPAEGPEDSFRENFNVLVENLKADMTLDQYYQAGIPVFERYTKEFAQHEHGYTALDGEKARWDVVSHKMGPLRIKVLLYTMIRQGRGYLITFSAADDRFGQYKDMFCKIAESFRFE